MSIKTAISACIHLMLQILKLKPPHPFLEAKWFGWSFGKGTELNNKRGGEGWVWNRGSWRHRFPNLAHHLRPVFDPVTDDVPAISPTFDPVPEIIEEGYNWLEFNFTFPHQILWVLSNPSQVWITGASPPLNLRDEATKSDIFEIPKESENESPDISIFSWWQRQKIQG